MLKSRFIASCLLSCCLSVAAQATLPTLTLSMADQYYQTREQLLGDNQIENLQDFADTKIVLIPGIGTELYPKPTDLLRYFGIPIPKGTLKALYTQYEYLQDHGVDVEYAPMSTLTSCAENGHTLVEYIKNSPKKLVFITHSKGSIDLLYALAEDPSISSNISAWISLQGPFAGSPIIDHFILHSEEKNLYSAISCLSEKESRSFLLDHQEAIAQALEPISWVFLTSWKKPGVPAWGFFDGPILWMNRPPYEAQSDGLIPTTSGCLLDYPCVVLENLDHGSTVMDLKPFFNIGQEERIILTRTLLEMTKKNLLPK